MNDETKTTVAAKIPVYAHYTVIRQNGTVRITHVDQNTGGFLPWTEAKKYATEIVTGSPFSKESGQAAKAAIKALKKADLAFGETFIVMF